MATNNLALILELMEILHHCSHFPILLMTSSVIRTKTFQILFHRRNSQQIQAIQDNQVNNEFDRCHRVIYNNVLRLTHASCYTQYVYCCLSF